MNTRTAALVETLTAEVRVLVVGSRQVTAGVASQLDQVHYADLRPFGRINLRDETRIIGARRSDNALVTSHFPGRPVGPPVLAADHTLSIRWCACRRRNRDGRYGLRWHDGRDFLALESDIEWAARAHGLAGLGECAWETDSTEECWRRALDAAYEIRQDLDRQHQEATALPLIVLASMR